MGWFPLRFAQSSCDMDWCCSLSEKVQTAKFFAAQEVHSLVPCFWGDFLMPKPQLCKFVASWCSQSETLPRILLMSQGVSSRYHPYGITWETRAQEFLKSVFMNIGTAILSRFKKWGALESRWDGLHVGCSACRMLCMKDALHEGFEFV